MSKTGSYRRHHQELRQLIAEIEDLLRSGDVETHLEAVSAVVRKLFGKFGTHLAIEDKALYPKAIGSADRRLSELATRFQNEMGPISTQFEQYRKKWPGPLAISKAPDKFTQETIVVIEAFKYRLEKEESELYELYDQVA